MPGAVPQDQQPSLPATLIPHRAIAPVFSRTDCTEVRMAEPSFAGLQHQRKGNADDDQHREQRAHGQHLPATVPKAAGYIAGMVLVAFLVGLGWSIPTFAMPLIDV